MHSLPSVIRTIIAANRRHASWRGAAVATGTRVKLHRSIETLEGETVKGPLKIGQVVRVRLRLDLAEHEDYVMIEERRASLCEFATDHIGGASARWGVHHEFRDDR